jgi:hypothetical protein
MRLVRRVSDGRDRQLPAPKEQPPRKLSGKRTVQLVEIWKETSCSASEPASAEGIALSGEQTDGAFR